MLTRRDFLQFIVGGTIGTLFSPLPWRMADEMALFSQRWTYQPPKGKENWVHAVCQLCPGGCGLKVRKIDERVVKIEGNSLNPINRGGLCPLGAAGIQLVYGDHRRIKKPLKRVGKRGEDKWEEIEWSMALNVLLERLQELRKSGKGHALACIDGYGNTLISGLIKRFCQAYGTPNYFSMGVADEVSSLAIRAMQGHDGCIGFDLENSNYILSFGSQLWEGWGIPVRMQILYSHIYGNPNRPKAKIIQFEPRMSDTAAKVDEWVPVKPGTEGALALGVAHVIVKEGLYNQEFVTNYTKGFESFKKRVLEKYAPHKVAEITGVAKEEISRIAREFAKAKFPVAVWGRGKGDIPCGFYEVMAIQSLNALVGNINRKGGVICFKDVVNEWWSAFGLDNTAKSTLKKGRADGGGHLSLLHKFSENVKNKKYPIEVLVTFEANPCYAAPDPVSFKQALENIPFIVSFSAFMDETTKHADLVLPTAFFLERWDGITTPKGLQYPIFGVSRPVLKSAYDVKHPADIILFISKKINGLSQAMPWDNYKAVLITVAKKIYEKGEGKIGNFPLPGSFNAMWEKLNENIWLNPDVKREGFKTASGKFEFIPAGFDVPRYEPWQLKGDKKEFPFTLIPLQCLMLTDGYMASAPYMMKALASTILIKNDLVVEIHPATATKCHLMDGDRALLKTPFGEAQVRVRFSEGINKEMIAIPIGLGHKAYDEYLKDKGINAHEVLGYAEEKFTGIATWALSRVNLIKI
ncbi:MAG TPA: hypothetical protein ENF30_00530 [Candidatus Desulfofervidus auxilii]|uniref:4Fe-4S Mo/W bis-MGD-type domain-containing protein n=1 Tax=Desulfofervidus auxilii TaxID=1621989 RepID=A0A7V0I9L4_DESA2|nr:hypothetical protein [Candidatus Desulfofervidus auxilii]